MSAYESSAAQAGGVGEPLISIENLSFAYGSRQIIEDLDLRIASSEFLSVVGPSGVGKTTLLECLSGLRLPTGGVIRFAGAPVSGPPRGLAVVFQDYSHSLMPWLSSRDNVALPLKSAGISRTERRERAMQALSQVGLEGNELKYPWQMSGGQQQRIAIARALACNPKVIIMDEPFASVDAQTRAELEDLVLRVRDESGVAVVLVTHDIDEAVYLGDRVLVLAGRPSIGRPARMVDLVDVPLGRGRDQIATKALQEFVDIRSRVYGQIRSETGATA